VLVSRIAGFDINPGIMNASGALCTTIDELEALGKSRAGAIVIKSTTIEPRAGNAKPRFHTTHLGSINSMGLPNLGYKEYAKIIPHLKKFNKPVISSVAGLQPADFPIIAEAMSKAGADMLEINLSCPNIAGKPQIAHDFVCSEDTLEKIVDVIDTPFGIKLPPYFDEAHHKQMAAIIKKFNPAYISCINSPGSTLVIDPEKEEMVIRPKFGGLGGEYVKPIALGNVRRFYEILGGKTPIIGCGGIKTGTDIFEHLLVGATAVQVGTQLMKDGPGVFARLERELETVLKQKGYSDMSKVIGKAKEPAGRDSY